MLTRLTHQALLWACRREDRAFRQQRDVLEKVQRAKLAELLQLCGQPKMSWETFRDMQPLSRYRDWQGRIAEQKSGGEQLSASPLVRYQPTSGSSEQLKLIPYTKQFLSELDSAIAPWLSSLYRQHPGLHGGAHYWSVSWLPKSQQEAMRGNLNDDSELLGVVKRVLAAQSQAVPSAVALAHAADDAMFATLCYLVARTDLRMLSVWSPTFALQQLQSLQDCGEEIVQVLAKGHWGKRAASLSGLPVPRAPRRAVLLKSALALSVPEMTQQLWPDLALVSAWDTADAQAWAQELRKQFPHAGFEGKGLWATEGVVTLPYEGLYPLAYRSHVYEFEVMGSERMLAPWQLREGDEVSPVISGGNGLLRYRLDDRLQVTGFWGSVPCFRFLGRRFGVDLVGEKMAPETARDAMAVAAQRHDLAPVTLLAVDAQGQGRPRYIALFSALPGSNPETAWHDAAAAAVEEMLCRHFHYELARDLRQLPAVAALVVPDGWRCFQDIVVAAGMIEGNIKPEPVKRVTRSALQAVLPALMKQLQHKDAVAVEKIRSAAGASL
ncbi:MAG: GH3 auxin-responsive promoter family protein [Pedobacter sp.]|nr:GH3 auxin-responsive promoter family protein [Pedobacter sp.]